MIDSHGIVRRPRRPPGWNAPGPAPATPTPAPYPRGGEDLCHLAGDWRIFQRLDGHRWSLDDLVTAAVAAETVAATPPARIVDLGAGIGSVLLLLAWRFPQARVDGLEAQAISVDLARRSIAWNGVAERCRVISGDLRDAGVLADRAPYDLVTGTPPYLPLGTATASPRPQRAPSRLEERGGIEDYCVAAAPLLDGAGGFVVCAGATQDDRVRRAAARAELVITRRVEVVPRAGKAPLFAVYVMAPMVGGSASPMAIGEMLVVRDRHGRRTDAFRALRGAMGMPP
jgi:tRNA1(Val) A37 N6-methylase TrmN6